MCACCGSRTAPDQSNLWLAGTLLRCYFQDVSIEALKQELSALNANEQRHLTAFLVSLQDAGDAAYRK